MTTRAVSAWQKRRCAFTHDWLKNQFILALARWFNLLDDEIEDGGFERSFLIAVLPQWLAHRDEALALVGDFECAMSPRTLLLASSCSWHRDLVHAIWLNRYPVRSWVDEATIRVQEVDRAYQHLQEQLRPFAKGEAAVVALRPFRADFAQLRNQCRRLAQAIEVFPSEVLVT